MFCLSTFCAVACSVMRDICFQNSLQPQHHSASVVSRLVPCGSKPTPGMACCCIRLQVRQLAIDVKSYVPEKAYEVMSSAERDRITAYVTK
jgi:hypothetical protein